MKIDEKLGSGGFCWGSGGLMIEIPSLILSSRVVEL
jgi:hypothetical protein